MGVPGTTEGINLRKYLFVYIIESPEDRDLFESRTEGQILKETLNLAHIKNHYSLVVNELMFGKAIKEKLNQIIGIEKAYPIIHISAHGNEQGIQLTNDKFISWQDLKGYLLPINKLMGGLLILCLSSCKGFSGCSMANTFEKDLPFYFLIGPTIEPSWGDAAVAFVTFYHHVFNTSYTFKDAVKAMSIASGLGDNAFDIGRAPEIRDTWLQDVIKLIQDLKSEQTPQIASVSTTPQPQP